MNLSADTEEAISRCVELVPRSMAATRRSPSPTGITDASFSSSASAVVGRAALTRGSRWPWHTLASNSGSLVARSPSLSYRWPAWLELLRWHKPTGRLILLLPAAWSLWLQSPRPDGNLVMLIIIQFIIGLLFAFNVVNRSNDFLASFYMAINRFLEPVLRPIRNILPNTGAIDFSPLVLIILLNVVLIVLGNVIHG